MKRERALGPEFLADLKDGMLSPLLGRVKRDRSVCLELRGDRINLYYRGGSLLQVARGRQSAYVATFDRNYFSSEVRTATLPARDLRAQVDVDAWVAAFPRLKEAMDS